MVQIALEVTLILLLIVANGVFALAEIAIVSSRRARLQQRAEQGDAGARVALELAREPSRFLSTVQIGISLVGVLAGAFGGATLASAIAARVAAVPALAPYSQAIGLVVVVVAITYLSLVVGELVPKRLGLANPERAAALMARPMRALSRVAAPVVKVLTVSSDALLRLLGARGPSGPPITVEELRVLLEQGATAGVFEAAEHEIFSHALNLDERRIGTVMTPRPDITWLDLDRPLDELRAVVLANPQNYFLAGRGSLDNVIGVVSAREFLAQWVTGQPPDWSQLLHPPRFVPESQTVLDVLSLLRSTGEPLVVIIDEFGGAQGMATMRDVVEALVGDIHSPNRPNDPPAVQREDGSWLLDGRLPAGDLKELLDLRALPEESEAGYDTVGGLVMTVLGAIPTVGQHFDLGPWRVEVVDMDGHRVDRVLVMRAPDQDGAEA